MPKTQDEDDPGHELGEDGEREAPDRDHPVCEPVTAERCDDTAENRERDDQDEGERGELERVHERVADQLTGGDAQRVRLAEVAGQEARDPVPVLGQQRLVGAELLVEVVDGGLVGERSEDPAADVTGENVRGEEDEHAEEEERDRRQAEPLEQEPSHALSPRE